MNDLLSALKKERRTLDDRFDIIRTCLNRLRGGLTHECVSTQTYTDSDLQETKDRLDEVEIAIKAITEHRKNKDGKDTAA